MFKVAAALWIHTRIEAWCLLAEGVQGHGKLHVLLSCYLLGLHNGLDVGLDPLDITVLTVLEYPILEVCIASKSLNS